MSLQARAFAWWFGWPPRAIPRHRFHYRSVRSAPGDWPVTPVWWLARKDYESDAKITWRCRTWWTYLWADLRRALWYEPLLWIGLLDLTEGGWYKDARWSWPWRARAPAWRFPTPTIYTWPVYGAR